MRSLRLPELTLIQSRKHPSYYCGHSSFPLTRVPNPLWHTMSPESSNGPEVRLGHSKAVLPSNYASVHGCLFFKKKKQIKKPRQALVAQADLEFRVQTSCPHLHSTAIIAVKQERNSSSGLRSRGRMVADREVGHEGHCVALA